MTRRDLLLTACAAAASPAAAQAPDIFAVVRAGDVEAVKRLLTQDPSLIGARDARGVTPMLVAAFRRQGVGFMRPEDNPMFAALAPFVTAPDPAEACLLRRRDAVATAVRADPGLAKRPVTPDGRTLLHYAAYVGDVALIDLLLDAGADIDAPAKANFLSPPILQTIFGDRQAAMQRLIRRGANVDAVLDDGSRPMHEAGLLGRDGMVRMLAKAGAQAAPVRRDGKTPRDLAAGAGHAETAKLLEQLAAG